MEFYESGLTFFRALEGVRKGLTRFAGPSRVALLFARSKSDQLRVCDYYGLLNDHKPAIKKLFVDNPSWRDNAEDTSKWPPFNYAQVFVNPGLHDLIALGQRSKSLFYQLWMTELHPGLCNPGPIERWLQQAAWLLSHDLSVGPAGTYSEASKNALEGYAPQAVLHHINSTLNNFLKRETKMQASLIVDSILGISTSVEEGKMPEGTICFLERDQLDQVSFAARFTDEDAPQLRSHKHVGKALAAVADSGYFLIGDCKLIHGIGQGALPDYALIAKFRRKHGDLSLGSKKVCAFSQGRLLAYAQYPVLHELDSAFSLVGIAPEEQGIVRNVLKFIVDEAVKEKHGCTIVLDCGDNIAVSGQSLATPIDLRVQQNLSLACQMSRADGALVIRNQVYLSAFACILHGSRSLGEDLSRGARFNSAVRFVENNKKTMIIVVSEDGMATVLANGLRATPIIDYVPPTWATGNAPTLDAWLKEAPRA